VVELGNIRPVGVPGQPDLDNICSGCFDVPIRRPCNVIDHILEPTRGREEIIKGNTRRIVTGDLRVSGERCSLHRSDGSVESLLEG
jgi:hypothetical protein